MNPRDLTDQAQRDGAALERARILGVVATEADASELAASLRAYHERSDRGELQALLVRLWGPSPRPPMTPGEMGHAADLADIQRRSDLRGLARRESLRQLRDAQAADELASLALQPE